jgi:nitroreductase
MPEFLDVVHSQRAHRRLLPDAVPDEVVEEILDAATHAPSAENRQPWAFVVVRDRATREGIAAVATAVWEAGGREHSRPHLAPALFDEVDRWATSGLAAAPVHVVVCGDTRLAPEPLLASSVYPAVQNLLLAAQAAGLGSLMSTLALAGGAGVRRLLGIPDEVIPMAVVPLGRPAVALGPPRRVAAREKTHRDRWGEPW